MAAKYKLFIEQGATFRQVLTWKDASGAPVDVTGCVGRMQVRPSVDSDIVLLELTSVTGGVTFGGATGAITLFISAAQTAGIDWLSGVYDLEVEFPDGTVRRLIYGNVSVSLEVTR
jgi:hypothetical protein